MIKKIFFSTRTMGVLLVVYAFAMAAATFIENDYGTPVAKTLIYNSLWFELIMVVLVVNFLSNISRYKLYKKAKWPLLIFHLGFLFIFLGGTITRYLGFEGTMHIREGQMENKIVSEATFFSVQFSNARTVKQYPYEKAVFLPAKVPGFFKLLTGSFNSHYRFDNQEYNFRLLRCIPRAQDSIVPDSGAPMVLHLVTLENGSRKNMYIPAGTTKNIQGINVGFNTAVPNGVEIGLNNNELYINSALPGSYTKMADSKRDSIKAVNTKEPLHLRALYNVGAGLLFVIPGLPTSGLITYYEGDLKKNAFDPDLVTMEISISGACDTLSFYGGKGFTGFQAHTMLKDVSIALGYGVRYYYTPFYVQLDNFELEKYPGSNAPASFASTVKVRDQENQVPYRIYMNHTLDYSGFRFFQSSYDSDEKGTVLSVNHDEDGTNMTYIGYVMLFVGMFFTLFWKGTRFSLLNQQLKAIAVKKTLIIAGVSLLLVPAVYSQRGPISGKAFAGNVVVDKKHAAAFGCLAVQNFDGRIEPVNTLALEILRKFYRHDNFYNLDANQFLLAVTTRPFDWMNVPLIKVNDRGGEELLRLTNADAGGLTTILNLLKLGPQGDVHFLLENEYNRAFAKKAADQDNYDKEVIELNDKMQVAQLLLNGVYLRLLPVKGDPNNSWLAIDMQQSPNGAGQLVTDYFTAAEQARANGNWSKADNSLQRLRQYQRSVGASVLPSAAKLNWEVRFNAWNLFFKLMMFYSVAGGLLLFISFVRLFSTGKFVRYVIISLIGLILIAAALQTFGLAVRWYVSGHAPWSNGYEAVMFISLIGVVAGLLLYRNRNAFIPAAGALIAVILMGFAHGGAQMNPQITPLVPVLKSYWLMVHVAIITASYGFLGLSALLGMFVLLLHIANSHKRRHIIENSMRELTIVSELSMIVGLFMLTCGTFLGGMWANESWGRYWSWDPKETWAFISIIVYAFVLHARLIPGLKSRFLFNFLAFVSFSTVIMTYFGVNYYLSGLHSYAKGDPMPIPDWIYITLVVVAVISLLALYRYKKLSKP